MRVIVLLATLTLLASSSIVTASTPADSDEAVQGPKLQDWLQSVYCMQYQGVPGSV
jgi:hypothetical protein